MVIGHVASIKDTHLIHCNHSLGFLVFFFFSGGFVIKQSCSNRVHRGSCAQCSYVEARLGLSLSTFAYHRLAE